MRARSLKPGFFHNEDLTELPFEYRLLFAGLWTMADREGRLEDRPKKIKLTIFPGDNVDCEAGLQALHDHDFIIRYEHGKNRYIQVKSWSKHQSPHVKEAASIIPAYEEHQTSTVQAPDKNGAGTSVAALIPSSLTPDSGLLTPDSGSLRSPTKHAARALRPDPPEFLRFKATYPYRAGSQPWSRALQAITARLREGHSWDEILDGTSRYAEFCLATGKVGTEHVQQAARFCGPGKEFLQPWSLPSTKADVRLAGNLSAADEFMRRTEAHP